MKTNRHHLMFEREWYIADPESLHYKLRTNVAFIHVARIAVHNSLHKLMAPPPFPHERVAREVLDAVGFSNTSDAATRLDLLNDGLIVMNDIANTAARPEIADNAKDLHDHLCMQRRVLQLGASAIEAIEKRDLDLIAPSDQQHLLRLPRLRAA